MAQWRSRRRLNAYGGIRAGSGLASYDDIDKGGYETTASAGDVQQILWIPATDFYMDDITNIGGSSAGSNVVLRSNLFRTGSMTCGSILLTIAASSFDTGGFSPSPLIVPVLYPSANITGSPNTAMTAYMPVPTQRATSGCLQAFAHWTNKNTHATSGSVSVFNIAIGYFGAGSAARTAGSTGASVAYNFTASGILHRTSLGNLPSWTASDMGMALAIKFPDQTDSADTTGSSVALLGIEINYRSDRHGTQAT